MITQNENIYEYIKIRTTKKLNKKSRTKIIGAEGMKVELMFETV